MSTDLRHLWDREAETFDDAADHGLRDPEVRRAWTELLLPLVQRPASRVADVGCGTGTLSTLLAEHGHHVTGVDYSPQMIQRAEAKAAAAGVSACFVVADAGAPPLPEGSVDLVLSRHVLWAMPDPRAALEAWTALLDDDGRLVLVEGRWSTGAGLAASETVALVEQVRGRRPSLTMLDDARYWGRRIDDERYLVVG